MINILNFIDMITDLNERFNKVDLKAFDFYVFYTLDRVNIFVCLSKCVLKLQLPFDIKLLWAVSSINICFKYPLH